jgi:hypothetical protein
VDTYKKKKEKKETITNTKDWYTEGKQFFFWTSQLPFHPTLPFLF